MKTETRYTKLTHEAAFKLLQENNWRVENCKFDGEGPYYRGPRSGSRGKLIGLEHGRFVQANGIGGKGWELCWKVDEVQVFEVGDRVRLKNADHYGLNVVGGIAKISACYENGAHHLEFGELGFVFFPEELELAPEPFDEWKRERELHFGELSLSGIDIALDAFNAGRDYERKQK